MRTLRSALLLLAASAAPALAQTTLPPFQVPTTNPPATVRQRVAATDVEVEYNRPRVKGRTIFGGLVPWGQVWRTGSDRATRITFSTPVTLGGARIDAGSYELFTIPSEDSWTVIIHRNQSQWGSYSYDPANDVVRLTSRPVTLSEPVESFTISIDDVASSSATLNIAWDRTRVPVLLEVDLEETVLPRLEEALRQEGRRPWFLAAMFYFENDLDIDRAAELIGMAVEESPNHIGILHRQALILERKGDVAGAIQAAEKSLAGAAESPDELRLEYTRLNAALLARLRR